NFLEKLVDPTASMDYVRTRFEAEGNLTAFERIYDAMPTVKAKVAQQRGRASSGGGQSSGPASSGSSSAASGSTPAALGSAPAGPAAQSRVIRSEASDIDTKGGIDFQPAQMNLKIEKGKKIIPASINTKDLKDLQNIRGFIPIMIDIQPIQSLPLFLGSTPEPKEKEQLSLR
ncbi:MAG: hypothetical protein NUV91_06620, partial [Candidatus Omnitrophica bacterium]|nr:hypothetical protein [Candidatus Omnitrophota bacterium]